MEGRPHKATQTHDDQGSSELLIPVRMRWAFRYVSEVSMGLREAGFLGKDIDTDIDI